MNNMVFQNNEECAAALYRYLVSHGYITARDPFVSENNILHDINNLRGHEWLDLIDRNLETKVFFDYLGGAEFLGDEFVYGSAVAPNILLKIALNEDFPENITFNEVRDALDSKGYQELWDFSVDDLDEALENLSEDMMLIGVSFYEDDTYFARIFEITEEMALRLDDLLVMTERGDCVLPSDVRSGDVVIGPYKKSLDEQIGLASTKSDANDLKEFTLVLCKGEEDEEVVTALLSSSQVQMIKRDLAGELNSEFIVQITDGRNIEVGIIDEIHEGNSTLQKEMDSFSER